MMVFLLSFLLVTGQWTPETILWRASARVMAPSACVEARRLSDRLFQEDVLVLSPFIVSFVLPLADNG
jgi:hypothetical protein